MRIGLLEIVATVFIIIAILLIIRITRQRPGAGPQKKESSTVISSRVKNAPGKRTYLRKLGVAFLAVGIVFALSGISMFRWAVQVYLWAFIAVVLGAAILFLSRKK